MYILPHRLHACLIDSTPRNATMGFPGALISASHASAVRTSSDVPSTRGHQRAKASCCVCVAEICMCKFFVSTIRSWGRGGEAGTSHTVCYDCVCHTERDAMSNSVRVVYPGLGDSTHPRHDALCPSRVCVCVCGNQLVCVFFLASFLFVCLLCPSC